MMDFVWIQWTYTMSEIIWYQIFKKFSNKTVLLNKSLLSTVYTHVVAIKYNIHKFLAWITHCSPPTELQTLLENSIFALGIKRKNWGLVSWKNILKWLVGIRRHSQYSKRAQTAVTGKKEEWKTGRVINYKQLFLVTDVTEASFCPSGLSSCSQRDK